MEVATGVAIYGGYDAKSWKRGFTDDTVIEGMPEAVFADKATGVLLQLLTVNAADRGLGFGASVYGIRAVNGSKLTLQNVAVRAGAAPNGAAGASGTGRGSWRARRARSGRCEELRRRGPSPGGAGGDSAVGRLGGKGGDGGKGGNGVAGRPGLFGTLGGPGGKGGEKPARGENGADGTRGEPGLGGDGGTSTTTLAATSWRGVDGSFGRVGGAGNGGGGGGGGGYKKNGLFQDDWPGSGGGGGGGGGAPGRPGDGGHFGGGSFGVYLFNSAITTESSTITAGNGGRGGTGGDGGAGGKGGDGGRDAGFPCGHGGLGGAGGKGGDGGVGGAGGGGAGGPSIGVMKVGTSTATLTSTTIKVGTPGAGGSLGAGGDRVVDARPARRLPTRLPLSHTTTKENEMTTVEAITPDLGAVKQRQQQMWASGDFHAVATLIQPVAETLVEAVDLRADWRVLDVATGSGNAAIAAARCGCDVVGIDYVPGLLARGRRRVEAEGRRASTSSRATRRRSRSRTRASTPSCRCSARCSRRTTSRPPRRWPASAAPAAGSGSPRGRRTGSSARC